MIIENVRGKFRVYFNRHGAEPLMWCVAPEPAAGGDVPWEVAVREVCISAPSKTVFAKKATADEDDGRPSAWIEVDGVLAFGASGAVIQLRDGSDAVEDMMRRKHEEAGRGGVGVFAIDQTQSQRR